MRIDIIGRDDSKISYVVVDSNAESYKNDTTKQYDPPITDDTIFAVMFNNRLMAINPATGSAPEKLTFYRFQEDGTVQFPVATIKLGEADMPKALIDLSAANDEEYQYIFYPEDENRVYAGAVGTREATGLNTITGYVACEEVVVSNWSDAYNAYVADKIFYFDANNQPQPINNNAVVVKNQTFGRFFNIQHGATNVLSGQLSSMIGYVDCNTMEFISTFEMDDAIRWLTTDQTTKFYKSARGYVLPVDITSAITFTPEKNRKISNVSFEWTECDIPHTPTVIGVIE